MQAHNHVREISDTLMEMAHEGAERKVRCRLQERILRKLYGKKNRRLQAGESTLSFIHPMVRKLARMPLEFVDENGRRLEMSMTWEEEAHMRNEVNEAIEGNADHFTCDPVTGDVTIKATYAE